MTKYSKRLRGVHGLIISALERDAKEGRPARGEMAAELKVAIAEQYDSHAAMSGPAQVEGDGEAVYQRQPSDHAALLEAFDSGRRAAQADAAEEIGRLREGLARCRHQASYSIGCEDALRIQLGKVRDVANEALAAHHKTEQDQEQ